MKLNDKHLESFLAKAEADPQIMEIMKAIIYWCQTASAADISLEEVAAVGTVGWQIAKDPKLQELLEYIIKMNEMGLGPEQ
jgi:hypothetical protein